MLNEMLIIDLETGGLNVEDGIFEVAILVIRDNKIIDKLHLGVVENVDLIHLGYGQGYEEISTHTESMQLFKDFLCKYAYPLVAHNGSFDRKFLIHYEWIAEDHLFYDTIRAFRLKMPGLFSYSMTTLIDFFDLGIKQQHTALSDVEALFKLLKIINPEIWVPIGQPLNSSNGKGCYRPKNLSSLNTDFEVIKNIFTEKNIVFTGKGPYVRNDLMQLAKKCGADVSSNSITKKTNLLVVGEDAGSKLQKAIDLGIEIMDMSDFFEMTSGVELVPSIQRAPTLATPITTSKSLEPISNAFLNEVISFVPMKVAMAEKLSNLIKLHNGTANTRLSNKTTLLVYQLPSMTTEASYISIEKAKSKNIPTLTLGQFNKFFIDKTTK